MRHFLKLTNTQTSTHSYTSLMTLVLTLAAYQGSLPKTWQGRNASTKVLSDLHMCAIGHVGIHTYIYIHTNLKKVNKNVILKDLVGKKI